MKTLIKEIIGSILIKIHPKRARELVKNGLSFDVNNEFKLTDRLMRAVLLKNAEKSEDFNKIAGFHHNFWKEKGRKHFSNSDNVLERFFMPHCAFLFEKLEVLLKEESQGFHTMVEIGTGDGDVLDYLSSKFIQIERFVGIDLSMDQIEFNKKKYEQNSKLEFVAIDGFDWIKENGKSKMIFFTSGGVLEYFTEQQLEKLFSHLNQLGSTIFIAIEPIGVNIDFTTNPNSQPYGHERSFSHDYARLFQNAGFKLWHESTIAVDQKEYFFGAFGARN